MSYSVTLVEGVGLNSHRGIAFLECAEEKRVDAKRTFQTLKEKSRRDLRGRIDLWLSGYRFDRYFHGWPNNEAYKHCFVFKWKQAGANHRLYGFLFHPKPLTNQAFQACILVLHSQKKDETDFSELDYINRLRVSPNVIRAVRLAFSD